MKVEIIKLKPYIDIFPRVCLDNKTVKHRNKKKESNKYKCRKNFYK